ncbi:Muskelin N-terminus-domain-containing protein [Roridomyces roridus]|uniref:Muskelin N-terminus-domain-containing protein n=1 Tax=Roridomyces roridus TaxID=1738132 RepID=A0AAD7CEK2_9AGAR|nr:Muskelin N-terminus-domain-containing protein [Roridomyces roridus]
MACAPVSLPYTIAASTPHSGNYKPEHILVDIPSDQSSRWSAGPVPETGTPQWLLLRLDTLAVVQYITLGKYSNVHPCNMKDFKILAGPSEDALTEVLQSSLRNDTHAETFEVKHVNDAGIITPFRYVKLIPLSCHGTSFHISIWFVSLQGIKDPVFVEEIRMKHEQYRETTAMRYVLKHLRQHRFLTPYNTILARCGLQVEDPLVSELFESTVSKGDWAKAESSIQRMSHTDLFDQYRNSKQCHFVWQRLHGRDNDGDVPPARGGHAMCVDHSDGVIYLFGGWNGKTSLEDFWAYDIVPQRWRKLSEHTSLERDAPSARSCHKMVYHDGYIYVLGRLNDADALKLEPDGIASPPDAFKGCEFYRYHIHAGTWECLSTDPEANAPPLMYDHQMVVDCNAQMLYVFGGRVLDGDWANYKYAGLYSYDIQRKQWQQLQPSSPSSKSLSGSIIPARYGHSMVLDERTRTLYIFGGKTKEESRHDIIAYDVLTKTTRDLTRDCGFETSFTRAIIDPKLQEIYLFSGLSNDPSPGHGTLESKTRIFRYNPPPGRLDLALPVPGSSSEEPQPRFAHQVVYDPKTRTVFMHGGNAGLKPSVAADDNAMMDDGGSPEMDTRLDDFWQMTFLRMPVSDVVRRATLQIRKQQFREMCEDVSPAKALKFLRTSVLPVVDEDDPAEAEAYRGLLSYLFTPSSPSMSSHPHLKTPSSDSEHEDSPPRKRSRPNTPEDSEMSTPPGADAEIPAPAAKILPFDVQVVKESEDPEEIKGAAAAISAARFQQRNALFESLMEFVSENAKQPSGSLVAALDGGLLAKSSMYK